MLSLLRRRGEDSGGGGREGEAVKRQEEPQLDHALLPFVAVLKFNIYPNDPRLLTYTRDLID